jgi:hypothetical protein
MLRNHVTQLTGLKDTVFKRPPPPIPKKSKKNIRRKNCKFLKKKFFR